MAIYQLAITNFINNFNLNRFISVKDVYFFGNLLIDLLYIKS